MLGHCRRRWSAIEPVLGQGLFFAQKQSDIIIRARKSEMDSLRATGYIKQ